ncbi:MAG: putative toxin-antitoxin system toxin component, PIN family [Saprospiraceae bacterium]|nr:putative toxin-antitoxin system toxin component, PIN family [Saprospiraceae bacterium]
MLVVLDTNILVSSLSRRSSSNWVIQLLMEGTYELAVTNEILAEYEEVLSIKYGREVAYTFLDALDFLPNVVRTNVYFNWNLLSDADDNKFVDAAVACGADALVSEDRGFRILSQVEFPKLVLLKLDEFKAILSEA